MPRLTAGALKKRAEWDVIIEDELTVRVRRLDIVKAYMTGQMPAPLVGALGRIMWNAQQLKEDPAFAASIPQEEHADTVALLQRYVVSAVIDPVFVMEDDGNPDHCDVRLLTMDQLLKIWQSKPEGDETARIVPQPEVTAAEADAFRTRPVEVAEPVPDGAKVPPASEQLFEASFESIVVG